MATQAGRRLKKRRLANVDAGAARSNNHHSIGSVLPHHHPDAARSFAIDKRYSGQCHYHAYPCGLINAQKRQSMTSGNRAFNRSMLAAWFAAGALTLFGTAHAAAVTPPATHAPSATAAFPASGIYRPGQTWVVPGEWEFTVDSARASKVNIPDQGGGSWRPTQVILLTYSYRNIGFDDSANDRDGGPSTLAFSKAHIDVVDANDVGNGGAGNYPVRITRVEDTDGQQPGQRMVGAQWPYAFKKKLTAVKVTVAHYDSGRKLQEASFLVPVQGTRQATPRANKHAHHS